METALAVAPAAAQAGPVPAGGWLLPAAARRLAALAVSALVGAGAGMVFLAVLAGSYTVKRRLDIDVFPGIDTLPDPRIEALIRAAVGLLRW